MSFPISSKFRSSTTIINRLSIDKYPRLINRIIQRLHLRTSSIFNEDEKEQLISVFEINLNDLNLAVDACCYIFEQAAYTSLGPEALYNTLIEAGIDEAHAKVIGKLWVSEASNFVNRLKNRTLGSPSLDGIDYRTNVCLGTSSLTKLDQPTALFEFSITDSNKIRKGEMNDKIQVEFSHEELYNFFVQLDQIQNQLDNLSST